MSIAPVLRRIVVFGGLFGIVMGVVVWQAGGLASPDAGGRRGGNVTPVRPPDGDVVPIDSGASMGSGRGVRVTRDAVEVVNGVPLSYRAFEAAWDRQTPLPGGTMDERRIRTEDFTALVLHRRPTPQEPRPPAVEGPDTTRLTADSADLTMKAGASFRAELTDNVVVVRHDVDDDLTLRTDALDIERIESARGAEELHATSQSRVRIEADGSELEGTGLESDLGAGGRGDAVPVRVLLEKDVEGTLLARRGALTSQGGNDDVEAVPAQISCSGPAELVQLERATGRRGAKWLLVLQQNVVVRQAPVVMRCAALEIEFRRTEGAAAAIEILRSVADGGVVVTGSDAALGDTWTLAAERSTTTRDKHGGYQVDLDGGTQLSFDGTLRGRNTPDAELGRVEVTCKGRSTLHTDAAPLRAGVPVRSRMVFREDVVARQWSAAGDLETEIRAPEVGLGGFRGTSPDGRLDPDTLTARGTPEDRVHVRRDTLTSVSNGLMWRVIRDQDIERLLLSGRPSARIVGKGGANLLGAAAAETEATFAIDAKDRVEITWRHTPDAELNLAPGEPYVTALARGDVVVRRIVADHEAYRLESQAVDTTHDADLQPTRIRAYGDVVVTGRGERPGDRFVELRGDRLSADRRTTGDSAWVTSDVYVFGQQGALATARVREAETGAAGAPPEHDIRAEQLQYRDGGTLVVARRNARILLEAAAPGAEDSDSGEEPRADVEVRGAELRAFLRPPEAGAGTPEVVRLEGEGGVELTTELYLVKGTTITYDRITGVAVANGSPAQGRVMVPDRAKVARELGLEDQFGSSIFSDVIRVEFDPTAERPGRPRRVTCQGGTLRSLQLTDPDDPGARLERMTVRADGPIEMLGETASAEQNVEIVWDRQKPGGGAMVQDARVLGQRVEIDFDAEATGPARDRVRQAVVVGSRSRAAQLFSPRIDATADRIESRGPWIDLLSPWGRRVHVTRRDPDESFSCDEGRYNYVTQEFEAQRARAE